MIVQYKCGCMPVEADVFVRDRREGEDVANWVELVCGNAIGADHASRSPLCPSRRMEYVKIEVDPSGGPLGTITRH